MKSSLYKQWRFGNVVESPSNLSRNERQLLEDNISLKAKIHKATSASTSFSSDVIRQARLKALNK